MADSGLVRTTFPSAEDPGLPFYTRIEPFPPHVFGDGEWSAIVFYRDPGCVPADFNLLLFFDAPAAFACPLTVEGAHFWPGEPFAAALKMARLSGAGAVPVWFVPVDAVQQAIQDGVLTIGELAGLEGLLVGHATRYNETLHPIGGHQSPMLTLNAQGSLEDGRRFDFHLTEVKGEVKAIRINFR